MLVLLVFSIRYLIKIKPVFQILNTILSALSTVTFYDHYIIIADNIVVYFKTLCYLFFACTVMISSLSF